MDRALPLARALDRVLGITAAFSIKQFGIIGPMCARVSACKSKVRRHPLQVRLARMIAGALFAVTLALAPAFGGAADPYEIYSIQAMTGGLSFVGKSGQDGLLAYEQYFNKNGGINGRPIHFVLEDAATNPTVAKQLFSQLQGQHLPFVMGPTSAGECNAVWGVGKIRPRRVVLLERGQRDARLVRIPNLGYEPRLQRRRDPLAAREASHAYRDDHADRCNG